MKYAEALKKAGIPNRLVYYAEKKKELVHAFVTLWPELPEAKDAAAKIDEWFRNV
jgi:acetyl esterase/lipase